MVKNIKISKNKNMVIQKSECNFVVIVAKADYLGKMQNLLN